MIMTTDATILCSVRGGELEFIKGAAGERTTYLRRVGHNCERPGAGSIAVNLRPHVPGREKSIRSLPPSSTVGELLHQ